MFRYLLALISSCIAVVNIMPLPPFDGGLIVILAIEKIKGSIRKTYGRKGDAVVEQNFAAVDRTLLPGDSSPTAVRFHMVDANGFSDLAELAIPLDAVSHTDSANKDADVRSGPAAIINEVYPGMDGEDDEWVEMYLPSGVNVLAGSILIVDGRDVYTFSGHEAVTGGHYVVVGTGGDFSGKDVLVPGSSVELRDALGLALDAVMVPADLPAGLSWSRVVDPETGSPLMGGTAGDFISADPSGGTFNEGAGLGIPEFPPMAVIALTVLILVALSLRNVARGRKGGKGRETENEGDDGAREAVM